MHFDAGITIFRQLVQLGADGTFSELFRNRSPAPQPSLRPVVPAYHACYIPPRHSQPMPRALPSLNSSATIPPPPPATLRANHRFFTPLFSASSECLFSQLLCFHIYLRCPLVFFRPALSSQAISRLPRVFTSLHGGAQPPAGRPGSRVTGHDPRTTLQYPFRHASTRLLLRQPRILATIAQTHPIGLSCAARFSSGQVKPSWRPSTVKNLINSNAANSSSPSSRPSSSSCWPAASPSSCTRWSSSMPTPRTSGLFASPSSASARSPFSSSAICSTASAPSASSSSKS